MDNEYLGLWIVNCMIFALIEFGISKVFE